MKTQFKTIIVGLFLILFFVGCKSEKTENDLTKANLKGKVKSTKETPYKAVEKFGEVTKGNVYINKFYFSDDNLDIISSIKHIVYNEIGNETENRDYDSNGNTLKRRTFNYDEKGKRISQSVYNPKGLEYKESYKYDEKGNQIEWSWYNSDGKLKSKYPCKYDEKGNLIEQSRYNSYGELKWKHTYKYDEKGNEIEESRYDSDGELDLKYTSKYDEKGNKIEESKYNPDGELVSKTTSKYDKKGNKIEWSIYNSDGELVSKHTYEYDEKGNLTAEYNESLLFGTHSKSYLYKYDKKNNWIEKIWFEDNIPKQITERKIVYY
ncbi:MAG: hypothetical protein WCY06_00040 [Flavobacteriaceae bacterium]